MTLWSDFLQNNLRLIHKCKHYFPIYERHFARYKNTPLVFWEIGVSKGGSLQMWSRYFGPLVTIVGIDINPSCKLLENDNLHIRIGNQTDTTFLESLINEFGVPDIVLDDGSHIQRDIITTFEYMYPKISKSGIYFVEDLQTAYWENYGGGVSKDTFINRSKDFIDKLNADNSKGVVEADFITRHTNSITFYDAVIVFERGTIHQKAKSTMKTAGEIPKIGNNFNKIP